MPLRRSLFVTSTPYSLVPRVVCYRDTWVGHIPLERRAGEGAVTLAIAMLEQPSAVCVGTTNPGYLAFVNARARSVRSGSPFVVFVDPEGDPLPKVATVGYRRDYRDLARHTILWRNASMQN